MSKYEEMQQSHWVCYEFPDNSYYYGEVGYLQQSGVVHAKDNQEAANNPSNKLVRHGFGIYTYPSAKDKTAKYQGQWDRDCKQGQGKLTVPGCFVYEGGFKDGAYHEQGKMTWENGDCYKGVWKKNRMEGPGSFKHHEGFTLKGSFKANHFIDDKLLRNPQMGDKEYVLFRKQGKEVAKQKERNEKVKSGFVVKVKAQESQKIVETINKSNLNNRVPILLASQQSKFCLKSLEEVLSANRKSHTFDLRKAYLLKGQQKYSYKQTFAEMTRSTMREGGALVLNLDQSQNPFQHAFYPDLKQFYDSAGFNNFSWSRQTMQRKEVHAHVTGEAISESYVLAVWSKMKLGEQLKEEEVREKVQMRLQSILPFIKMDIIYLTQ